MQITVLSGLFYIDIETQTFILLLVTLAHNITGIIYIMYI
jgi:hypothetical protein